MMLCYSVPLCGHLSLASEISFQLRPVFSGSIYSELDPRWMHLDFDVEIRGFYKKVLSSSYYLNCRMLDFSQWKSSFGPSP